MAGTGIRATLHRAVFSVPSGDAQTRAILALSVLVAAGIALLQIAQLAGPARRAVAGVVHAVSVRAAIEIAQF